MEKKSKLSDSRVVYAALLIIVLFAAFVPIAWPIRKEAITQWTQGFYNTLTPILQKPGGANIYLTSHMHAGVVGDMSEAVLVVLKQCVQYHARIVAFGDWPEVEPITEKTLKLVYGDPIYANPLYGKEIIWLGYVVGGAAGVYTAHAYDIPGYTPRDRYGNSVKDMEMFTTGAYPKGAKDVDVIFGLDARAAEGALVIPFKLPMVEITVTEGGAYLGSSFTAGFFKGLILGQKGGAEYEQLVGIPGKAILWGTTGILVSLFATVGIIIGNIVDYRKGKLLKKEKT